MVYIDMDGVVVDFKQYVIDIRGFYDTDKVFWELLSQKDNPYLVMNNISGAYEFVKEVNSISKRYIGFNPQFLTSLPITTGNLITAHRDKVDWVKRNIGKKYQVNVVSNWRDKKYFIRNPWDILIDDSERNCNDWIEAGGQAILHTSFEDTLKKLEIMVW